GTPVGHKGKRTATVFATSFFELFLGLTHPSYLWVGVNHPWNGIEIDMRLLTGNTLGNRNTLVLGLMCQHRPTHDITDCPDVGQVGLAVFIDNDKTALVQFQAHCICT